MQTEINTKAYWSNVYLYLMATEHSMKIEEEDMPQITLTQKDTWKVISRFIKCKLCKQGQVVGQCVHIGMGMPNQTHTELYTVYHWSTQLRGNPYRSNARVVEYLSKQGETSSTLAMAEIFLILQLAETHILAISAEFILGSMRPGQMGP